MTKPISSIKSIVRTLDVGDSAFFSAEHYDRVSVRYVSKTHARGYLTNYSIRQTRDKETKRILGWTIKRLV
jgi:hypothetical protein